MALAPVPQAQAAPTTDIQTLPVNQSTARTKIDRADNPVDKQVLAKSQVVAELPTTDTDNFSTIGITWAAESTGATPDFEIRLKRQQGWSGWESLETGTGDTETASDGRKSTDPIYVGDSDGVELRTLGDQTTKVSDVKLTMIDSPPVAADANPAMMAPDATTAGDQAPRPNIVSRKGWGADESVRCGDAEMRDKIDNTVKGIVVHHTAGANSYSANQSASIIRGIYSYHVKTLGWCDIGYNFLVDKYGKIFEGRWGGVTLPVRGSHATSWNTNTMGVSFMGNYSTASAPAAMLDAGAKLMAWKFDGYYRNPKGKVTLAGKTVNTIFRHGDVMQTDCPGRDIDRQMGALRDNVARKMGKNSALQNDWAARGWLGDPTDMEKVVGTGRVGSFAKADLLQSPNGKIHWVQNSLRGRYDQLGGPTGTLGWPTSNEVNGLTPGSKQNSFERGRIVWTAAYGAWALTGGINNNYVALPSADRNKIGVPRAAEANGRVSGVRVQRFSGGYYYWSPRTTTVPLWGGIERRYAAIGSEAATIGLPTAKEGNGKVTGSRQVNFTRGTIVWTSGTGAWEIGGSMNTLYRSLGSYTTNLGAPTSTEYKGSKAGAMKQNFTRGRIYWSSATGAQAVYGDIGAKFRSLGEEGSRLGMPTSSEYGVTGGRAVNFQGGKITWDQATKKVTVTYK
ncbi:MAG: N-acetylmuramoyl-L-alanine amidase [Propionibacteriales bacterium]|nr:N-acetylmuramoyl-L-alanine amidase [Propionibacteriales bacterium]